MEGLGTGKGKVNELRQSGGRKLADGRTGPTGPMQKLFVCVRNSLYLLYGGRWNRITFEERAKCNVDLH